MWQKKNNSEQHLHKEKPDKKRKRETKTKKIFIGVYRSLSLKYDQM